MAKLAPVLVAPAVLNVPCPRLCRTVLMASAAAYVSAAYVPMAPAVTNNMPVTPVLVASAAACVPVAPAVSNVPCPRPRQTVLVAPAAAYMPASNVPMSPDATNNVLALVPVAASASNVPVSRRRPSSQREYVVLYIFYFCSLFFSFSPSNHVVLPRLADST